MQTVAWMGGSRPNQLSTVSPAEAAKCRELFQEQATIYIQAWGNLPPEIARLFWKRARYDAHASARAAGE